ncbi:cellulase family glycosylhydrolase [Leifsonia sp. H3M29-4]|uniref:glycoside hydrolase family 5 protein n=1 Tax=Salinibacterium metalliresistens TaxID=3031321 RepID=UPI0023DBE683|nr:cellulase family glycosylhydrolase [Salinibacterium metalliresistens]MDF1478096.1 cellulase family glycosylhydrolase [Salinibacterium metalliresistens]
MTDLHPTPVFARRPASFDGFVHARDARLFDGSGRELLLRGVGLGNWMLPEGYMWRFGPGAESPREIERLTERLLGAEGAQGFWEAFATTFITEADIALIAASGFDHVRLPINSRVIQDADGEPIETGYAMIDRLIQWCRTHKLWVLLDLHGAPGGQTGTNIDDSPAGKPELFMEPRYRELTLRLWRDLATRYAGETVVLGYDLLNEPLPNEWQHIYADDLAVLYRDLTAVVRAVDADHLIVYEGSHWATNWSVFTEVWDPNSLLQFHKYWSSPDRASIQQFLDARERLGLPIYMGEGGENTLEWIYTAFRLYEAHDIGWNFWPWKKIDTRTSPASIIPPEGWDRVVAAIDDPEAIGRGEAQRVFDDLLEAMRIEHCRWQPEVVAALLAERPIVVPAWGFGYRGAGQSYSSATAGTIEGIRVDDAVHLRWAREGDNPPNPFEQSDGRAYRPNEELVVDLAAGDWLEFEMSGVESARVLDASGRDAGVRVEPSARGIRVTATAPTSVARILPTRPGGTW